MAETLNTVNGTMKTLMGYEIYDNAARGYMNPVTTSGEIAADACNEYIATVEGINSLYVGASFIIIPHAASSNAPTLNVNNLGAKEIRQRVSGGNYGTAFNDFGREDGIITIGGWLPVGKPVRVTYDGTYWIVDFEKIEAGSLYGLVRVEGGGTGANNAADALHNLGIYWGTEEAPATGTPNTIYIQIN